MTDLNKALHRNQAPSWLNYILILYENQWVALWISNWKKKKDDETKKICSRSIFWVSPAFFSQRFSTFITHFSQGWAWQFHYFLLTPTITFQIGFIKKIVCSSQRGCQQPTISSTITRTKAGLIRTLCSSILKIWRWKLQHLFQGNAKFLWRGMKALW